MQPPPPRPHPTPCLACPSVGWLSWRVSPSSSRCCLSWRCCLRRSSRRLFGWRGGCLGLCRLTHGPWCRAAGHLRHGVRKVGPKVEGDARALRLRGQCVERRGGVVGAVREVGERGALQLAVARERNHGALQRLRVGLVLVQVVQRALVPHHAPVAHLQRAAAVGHVDVQPHHVALPVLLAVRLPLARVHLAALQVPVAVAVHVKAHRRLQLRLARAPPQPHVTALTQVHHARLAVPCALEHAVRRARSAEALGA
mmetsp:Transcript_34775/g.88073  ORF Transcript_34775/g.88073 Transcript_34775/m.88073 type:complete len:255 (+) Transcript_34775:262-1026(+)